MGFTRAHGLLGELEAELFHAVPVIHGTLPLEVRRAVVLDLDAVRARIPGLYMKD
jgi:hypothetical protein